MSSRQLRKLQQQRELERAKLQEEQTAAVEDSEEEAGDNNYQAPVAKQNLFANFAALQQEEDDEEEVVIGEKDDREDDQQSQSDVESHSVAITKKAKKPKKKKKKAKGKASSQPVDGPSTTATQQAEGPDEIDAALEELNIKNDGKTTSSQIHTTVLDPEYERVCALLGVNTQHLKVGNEMRNLFGRSALENHDDAGGAVPRGGRRRQRGAQQQIDLETALKGHHAPGKGLPELTLRRNIFIQGKEEWPRGTTAGLTMEVVDDMESVDGTIKFRFVHSQAYETLQQQFNMFVEMGDPQNLIGLLQRNPYHISLLLQVSKVAKDQSDHSLSSDLVERALFTFARATSSQFATKLSQGKARLDFARPENRELWLAGYHYIKSLIMKGTYRTALEWAKLLLSLDPEGDPYCMTLMIHHLAIRAHEFKYILDLADLPVMKTWKNYTSHLSPSLSFAALQLKDGARSRALLGHSIKHLPWLFCKLFQELNLDNPPPSIWGAIPRTDAENLFTEIYIRQTKDLWNTPEGTGLLVEVAHATDKIPEEDLPKLDNAEVTLDVARFVYLDNTPQVMALVPSRLLHRIPNSDSDPLPPDQNIFSWPNQRMAFSRSEGQGNAEGAFGDHFDPLAALRALIPGWTGNGGAEDEEAIEQTGLRELLEADLDRGFGDVEIGSSDTDEEAEDEPEPQPGSGPSNVRRLYEYLFGARARPEPSIQDEEGSASGGEESDLADESHVN